MIEYKTGDLFEAFRSGEIEALGHQANCFCKMGSGFAKQLVELYPEAQEADMQTIPGDETKLGTLTWVFVEVHGHAPGAIFNLYGQYNYGREPGVVYTDIEALDSALYSMRQCVNAIGIEHIGFPKLGAGLGGGDWVVIEALIEEHFGDLAVTIFEKD